MRLPDKWLLVTDILSRTVFELSQLIVQILDTFRFWTTLWTGRVETTYDVYLGLIGKRVVDSLLVLIELFSPCVTAEALRAKIDRKSAISLQHGHFYPKFQVEGVVNQWMPYNFVDDSFHTKKLCSRLSLSEVRFYRENGRFAFLSFLRDNARSSS